MFVYQSGKVPSLAYVSSSSPVILANRSLRLTCSVRSTHWPALLILAYAWIAETKAAALTVTPSACSIMRSRAARRFLARRSCNLKAAAWRYNESRDSPYCLASSDVLAQAHHSASICSRSG